MSSIFQKPGNSLNNPLSDRLFFEMPSELDDRLHKRMIEYVNVHSWTKLEASISKMIDDMFQPALRLAETGVLNLEEIEATIKSTKPSRTYLRDYVNGRPICIRYTNAISLFFNETYQICQHDPCADFLTRKGVYQKSAAIPEH